MVKVNIYGCGISGLTIAHELIEKGFNIEIYEKKSIAGGMARTFRYNNGVPTEHSWRGFGPFYKNTYDIMKRISIKESNTQRVLIEKQSFSIKMFRARIPNFRAGEFGKYEFFITLDGFIKNDLDIPYELMKKFASSRIIKAVKYCEKNKIAIIRYNLETMKCCGLKPDDLRDFGSIKAIETRKDSNDWIRYYEKNICEKNKYLRDFKNKKVKYSV